MSIPDEENGFACVALKDVKIFLKKGFHLMDKEKLMLFGLTEFLVEKDFIFSKKIAKQILNKELRKIAELMIEDFEFSYQLEKIKSNPVQLVQL